MEKSFYTDGNFERLLREQTDRFTMQPTKKVWHSVYNNLHPARRWPSVAISLLLVVSILLLGYLNKTNSSEKGSSLTAAVKQLPATAVAVQSSIHSAINIPSDNNNTTVPRNNTAAARQPNNRAPHNNITANAPQRTGAVTTHNNRRTGAGNTVAANSNNNTVNTGSTTIAETGNTIAANTGNNNRLPVAAGLVSGTTEAPLQTAAEIKGVSASANTIAETGMTASAAAGTVTSSTENGIAESSAAEKDITVDNNLLKQAGSNTSTNPAEPAKNARDMAKLKTAASMKTALITTEDKAWMDDHAFYNKRNRGRWKNKLSWNVYATPSVSYRVLFDNTKSGENGPAVPSFPPRLLSDKEIESNVTHKPGPGLEIGAALVYAISKKWRIKAGVQANYNSYAVYANEIAHPFSTTLSLNNLHTGNLDVESRFTSISNIEGGRNNRLNSYSYQLALPVGFDYKIKGNNTISWYAGASLQPSFVLGGNAYLLSADRQAYAETKGDDKSMMRKFNLAFGAETFVSYKKGNYTFMAGPKLRYQLLTTNSNAFTVGEKVYNFGLSLGVLKNF
jgi:hypothetical protein